MELKYIIQNTAEQNAKQPVHLNCDNISYGTANNMMLTRHMATEIGITRDIKHNNQQNH